MDSFKKTFLSYSFAMEIRYWRRICYFLPSRGVMTMTESETPVAYKPRVLVVDDMPANLDVLVEHFQDESIELAVAVTGEDALHLGRKKASR